MSVAYKLNRKPSDAAIDCVVLDVGFLNRNTFGDRALRNEIIGLFLAQLDGVQRTLASSLNQTSWQFLTHTLKGAAVAVGATGLSNLAEFWAKSPVPSTAEQRIDLLRQLKTQVAQFKQAIEKL